MGVKNLILVQDVCKSRRKGGGLDFQARISRMSVIVNMEKGERL